MPISISSRTRTLLRRERKIEGGGKNGNHHRRDHVRGEDMDLCFSYERVSSRERETRKKTTNVRRISEENVLPWKLNHKFTRHGCSSLDRISTSLATFFRAPRSAHSFLCTYFMAYILPALSRFCTMQTCRARGIASHWELNSNSRQIPLDASADSVPLFPAPLLPLSRININININ